MASETDDAAEAAARLEAALERIALLAAPNQAASALMHDGLMQGAGMQDAGMQDAGEPDDRALPVEEIAARLDILIDRLRAALGSRQD